MFSVSAFYQFADIPNYAALRPAVFERAQALQLKGTILLAREGINGTLAGAYEQLELMLSVLRALPGCAEMAAKYSSAPHAPFQRLKVRLKQEIVTMGVALPAVSPGTLVKAQDWNDLVRDPDTLLLDTRNDYEVDIGTFPRAINPRTRRFREFPRWWDAFVARTHPKRVAMFCTGGIRCEKSTRYVRQSGIDNVFHLHGGILQYLRDIPPAQSLWQGECFVFDGRVAVQNGLAMGTHRMCYGCRRPVSKAQINDPLYEEGASCRACYHEYSEQDRVRFRERHRQFKRASKNAKV